MHAAVLHEHGGLPRAQERPDAVAVDGQVLVATTAAALTPLDVLCASGTSYFGAPPLPYVPGVQGVGRLLDDVAGGPARGARVWFPTTAGTAPGDGSLAGLVAVDPADLVALPDGVDDAAAVALGLSAVAAWASLHLRARVAPGERVLVLGAGGVVGQAALQLARLAGAAEVHAACRSERAATVAAGLGADSVVRLADGDGVDELAARMAAGQGEPVDVVVDPLCGVPGSAALLRLAPGGRLVNLGGSAGDGAAYSSAVLRSGQHAVLGHTNARLTREERATALGAVLDHAAAGALRVEHEVVALDDVADAWRRQADGLADRRLVVRLAPDERH